MAWPLVSDELSLRIESLVPKRERQGESRERHIIPDRAVSMGILFFFADGHPVGWSSAHDSRGTGFQHNSRCGTR